MYGVCAPRKQARGKAGDKGGGKAGDRGGGKAGKGSNQKARGSAARGGGKGSKLSKTLTKEEASITGAIFHQKQVEEHVQLALQGFLKCFGCGTRSMCLGSFLVAVSPRETGAFDMIRVFCAGLYSTQVARLEVKDQLFTCWLCDDSALEQLRLRIPGYVPGSKTVIPELTQTSDQGLQEDREAPPIEADVTAKRLRLSADPQPARKKAVNPKPAAKKAVDPKPAAKKAVDPKPAAKKAVDPKPVRKEAVDPKPAPKKTVDPKPTPKPAVDPTPAPAEPGPTQAPPSRAARPPGKPSAKAPAKTGKPVKAAGKAVKPVKATAQAVKRAKEKQPRSAAATKYILKKLGASLVQGSARAPSPGAAPPVVTAPAPANGDGAARVKDPSGKGGEANRGLPLHRPEETVRPQQQPAQLAAESAAGQQTSQLAAELAPGQQPSRFAAGHQRPLQSAAGHQRPLQSAAGHQRPLPSAEGLTAAGLPARRKQTLPFPAELRAGYQPRLKVSEGLASGGQQPSQYAAGLPTGHQRTLPSAAELPAGHQQTLPSAAGLPAGHQQTLPSAAGLPAGRRQPSQFAAGLPTGHQPLQSAAEVPTGRRQPLPFPPELRAGYRQPLQFAAASGLGRQQPSQHAAGLHAGRQQPSQFAAQLPSGRRQPSQHAAGLPARWQASQFAARPPAGRQQPMQYLTGFPAEHQQPLHFAAESTTGRQQPSQYAARLPTGQQPSQFAAGFSAGRQQPPTGLTAGQQPSQFSAGFAGQQPSQYAAQLVARQQTSQYAAQLAAGQQPSQYAAGMEMGRQQPSQYAAQLEGDESEHSEVSASDCVVGGFGFLFPKPGAAGSTGAPEVSAVHGASDLRGVSGAPGMPGVPAVSTAPPVLGGPGSGGGGGGVGRGVGSCVSESDGDSEVSVGGSFGVVRMGDGGSDVEEACHTLGVAGGEGRADGWQRREISRTSVQVEAEAEASPTSSVLSPASNLTPESWSLFTGVRKPASVPPPLDGPGKGATFWPAGTASTRRRKSSSGDPRGDTGGSDATESDASGSGAEASAEDEEDSEGDDVSMGNGGGGGGAGSGGGVAVHAESEIKEDGDGEDIEDQAWEELSTDSSDCDLCTSHEYEFGRHGEERSGECRGGGHGGRGRRGSATCDRGGESEVFEWDRRTNRVGGCIDDVSRGLENVRIQVVNEVDGEKLPKFIYSPNYVMGKGVQQEMDPDSMACCDCTDGCRDPSRCACLRLQAPDEEIELTSADDDVGPSTGGGGVGVRAPVDRGTFNDGKFYSDEGLLLRERQAVFECHARCSCNPLKCKNRVVSNGVHLRLQGWGLRCRDRIPAGSFVACYLGEVLRDRDADERGKTNGDDYLFGLDFAKHETGRGGTCWDSNFGFNGNNNDNISAEATGKITSPIVISDPLPPEEQNGRTCRPDFPISKPLSEGGEDEDTSHSVSPSSELLSKGERERRKSHPVAAAAATESVARQSTAVPAGLAATPGEKGPPSGKAASTVAVAVARANGRAPPADASLPKVCDLRDFFSRGAPTGSGGSVSKGCVSNGKKSGENAGRTQPGDRRGSAGKSCVGDEKSCGEGTEGTQLRLTAAAAAAAVVALPVATSHRDPARETPTKTAVESLPSPKAPPSPGGMSTPLQRFMEKSGCKDASQAAPFMRGANGDVDAALETYFRVFPPKSCPAATNVPPKPRSAAMDVSLKSPSVAMDISPDSRPVAMDVEESIDCRMDVEKNSDHPKKDACKGSGEAEVGVGADASTKNVESLDFDLEGAAGGGTASAATGSGERVEMMTIAGVGGGGGGSGGTSPEKTLRHLSGDALVAWRAEWNRREREAYRREREEELEDTVMPDTTNADSTENVKGAPPPRPGLHAAGDRDRLAGDTILGDKTPGDKSAGCTSPGDKTAGDTRAGDKPANDTTPGDERAGDTTPGDKSAGGTKNLAAAVSPSLKTEGGRPTSPTLLKKEMGMSGSAIEVLAQELDDSFVDGSSAETAWVIDEHSSEVPTPCWANALAPAAAAAAGSSSPSRRALAGKPSSSRGEKMVAALMRCFLRSKPCTADQTTPTPLDEPTRGADTPEEKRASKQYKVSAASRTPNGTKSEGGGSGGKGGSRAGGADEKRSSWSIAAQSPRSGGLGFVEALVVDAKEYGNVARFMNHSCDGNLTKHMVFAESHDARMPRLAFFAPQIIEPMEELTYDYGYVVGGVEGKSMECRCGAADCRGRLL
eukprot:jgi/Undpi1/12075/HiC_scaffold_4.g01773.m1